MIAQITCASLRRHCAKDHSELKYLGRTELNILNMLFVLLTADEAVSGAEVLFELSSDEFGYC